MGSSPTVQMMWSRLKRLFRRPPPDPVTQTLAVDADAMLTERSVKRVVVSAALVRHPVESEELKCGGWLSPTGVFLNAPPVGGAHREIARRILEPNRPDDPARDFERELEQLGYAKYTERMGGYSGWYRVRRLTRPQRDFITNWYLERGRKLPAWLDARY